MFASDMAPVSSLGSTACAPRHAAPSAWKRPPGGALAGALLSFLVVGCTVTSVRHDPEEAARVALAFAEMALLQRDVSGSHALLSDSAKKTLPLHKYGHLLGEMHPTSFPLSLSATEFEPIPGQKTLSIFIEGENGLERFYYRIPMENAGGEGYRVVGVFRGAGPYPPRSIRQRLREPLTI